MPRAFIAQALAGVPMTIMAASRERRRPVLRRQPRRRTARSGSVVALRPVDLGNPTNETVLAIAEEIRRLIGGPAAITFTEAVEDEPERRCPDITLARSALDWAPTVDVVDGLQRTIAWFTERRRV